MAGLGERPGLSLGAACFAAFFCVLTTVVFFGLGQGSGEDALPYTWPDLIATAVLWLAGLAAALLIIGETASPYYQQAAAAHQRNAQT